MGEEEDEVGFGGSFMELLGFARNVVTQNREESKPIELDQDQGFLFSPAACINHTSSSSSSTSSSSSYPHMLRFGGGHENFFLLNNDDASIFIAKGRSRARTEKVDGNGGGRDNTVVASRKPKAGSTTIKVRKEKIGDKISALQQLVSPFGKTDTATVLHEAVGYIRFLHDQVQVLSSAYLQQTGEQGVELREGDLRSRGLCLVPVSFTGNMTNTSNSSSDIIKNGADLWSPAASLGGGGGSSSS